MKNSIMDRVHELHAKAKALVQKQIEHHQGEIDKLMSVFGGGVSSGNKRGRKSKFKQIPSETSAIIKRRGKKRIRRSLEDIQSDAQRVVAVIKAAGKEGASAKDFPKDVKIIGSPKVWLKTYAKGEKIKMVGQKSKSRYIIA